MPMITIAGSGPSTALLEHATVATKKRSVPSDYVFCNFYGHYPRWRKKGDDTPLMLYKRRCTCENCDECNIPEYFCDGNRWSAYYRQFVRFKTPPPKQKASTGLCAVFCVVERWKPETIGLIGFDWILDENPDWEHDAVAERAAILSLVNVKDLRDDSIVCRL